MAKSKQQGWLDKYADGGNISGPKVPPIKLNGTEVYEHGEDTATADHEENGVEPTDLTKKGIKYAKAIGKQAAQQGKKAVISSDIERAVQTAGVMADEAGMQHTTNPLLRTWNIGEYDGKPEGSFKEKQWVKIPDKAVPGGESFDSFKDRMEKAYEMVKAAPKSDDIITHSKVTRAFKALEATDGHWTDNTTKKFQQLKDEPKKENGGWLDRFEQGGRLLEKKADNYGKHGNYNDAQVSTGPDFVGLGYNTKGRDYSPAWGGQFQMGGSLPGATGMMYARTQNPAPSNGKYAKKTKASAQNGTFMDATKFKGSGYQFNDQFDPTASPLVHPILEIKDTRKIDKASGNPITDQNKLEYEKGIDTNLVKKIVGSAKKFGKDPYTALGMAYEESGIGNSEAGPENPFHLSRAYDDNFEKLNTKYKGDQVDMFMDMLGQKTNYAQKHLLKKGDADVLQSWNGYGHITPKSEDNTKFYYGIDVSKHPINMNKNPVYGNRVVDVRDNIIKKDPRIRTIVENTPAFQNGGEMKFYQNGLDWTPKTISENGSVIKDDRGQWAHPGEITEIGSNNITMQGVDYPVLGVSDTGDTKLMKPGKDYKFKGKKVIEYPQAQNGWLDKYK